MAVLIHFKTAAVDATATIAAVLSATGAIVVPAAMPRLDNSFAMLAAAPKQLAAAVSAVMLGAKAEEKFVSQKLDLL